MISESICDVISPNVIDLDLLDAIIKYALILFMSYLYDVSLDNLFSIVCLILPLYVVNIYLHRNKFCI